jgi:phosphate transport system substrate-binding protein
VKRSLMRIVLPILLIPVGSGCGDSGRNATPQLLGAGSTSAYPLMSRLASEYQKAKGPQIAYLSTGSKAGIRGLIEGEYDFCCVNFPLTETELKGGPPASGQLLYVPISLAGVVVTYNLDEVREPLHFTGPLLADVFLGKVRKWDDPSIKKVNPSAKLPAIDITVVYRDFSSGINAQFTDYLSKVSGEWKQKVGTGPAVRWPVGRGAKGGEGPLGIIQETPGALGFGELVYALQYHVKLGHIQNKEGNFVGPTPASLTAAADAAMADVPSDLKFSLANLPGKNSYPISGVIWVVAFRDQPAVRGQHLMDFLGWVLEDGQQCALDLQYPMLPKTLAKKGLENLGKLRIGEIKEKEKKRKKGDALRRSLSRRDKGTA